jgi:hypothetical protein
MRGQIGVKDTQIGALLERDKETNTLIHRLQAMLAPLWPLAHKLFVALIKKHSGYGRPIQNEVSFTKRELMRLIGRAEWGGSASEQLTRALREIHYTFITTNFKAKNDRSAEHSFNIFPEIYLERAEHEKPPARPGTGTRGGLPSSGWPRNKTLTLHAIPLRSASATT